MSFNSLEFWLFSALVFGLYLPARRKLQNAFLLLASYYFYFTVAGGFVALLAFTTTLDFWCGRRIAASEGGPHRRYLLALSLATNLAVLFLFKYVGFFAALANAFSHGHYLEAAAPIGLSFYILQSMSYVIDVYRRESLPSHSLPEYALYISFFPQLLAGPIERAGRMLPQFSSERKVDAGALRSGLWLCFWGLIQKCVVADNLQNRVITPFFRAGEPSNGLASLMVLWFCCVRIYADFDGYSNIARGLARMMGIEIDINFRLPFYTVSSRDFWRHFHISFFRWAKDYLFLPMVESGKVPVVAAVVIVFVCSGLWHEISWPFLCWGLWEAFTIFVTLWPGGLLKPVWKEARGAKRAVLSLLGMFTVRVMRSIGVAFFVAASVGQALSWLRPVFHFSAWRWDAQVSEFLLLFLVFAMPLRVVEAIQLPTGDLMAPVKLKNWKLTCLVLFLLMMWLVYGVTGAQKFVYFQY